MDRNLIELYNEHFKSIRNRLRKYNTGQVVGYCLAVLPHSVPTRTTMRTYQRYPPWIVLLLMKWSLVHSDLSNRSVGRLNDQRFEDLINRMHAVVSDLPRPSTFDHPYLFLRKTAYQQFWYHNVIPPGGYVARQYAMFSKLEHNHRFRTWLTNIADMSIEDALDLSFTVITRFMTELRDNWISRSWFDGLKPDYDDDLVGKYLGLVGATPERLRQELLKDEPQGKRHYSEWHEPTPLMKFPLMELGGKFYCYSRPVLYHAINHLLFDRLREFDPACFMDRFGGIFERYVERGIRETRYEYLSEKELREVVGTDSDVTDFMLIDGSAHIYIEAKGTELSVRGMVGEYYDQVFDRAKNSAMHGVKQGMNCALGFERRQRGDATRSAENNYLLVVTYKPTFLPRGSILFGEELTGRLEARLDASLDEQEIPLENVYFLSVQDWDLLVSAVVNKADSMAELLRQIVQDDNKGSTAKFVIEQHISEKYPEMGLPPYLHDELEEGTARLERVLERTRREV